MKIQRKLRKFAELSVALTAISALSLAGCGGGGGGSGSPGVNAATTCPSNSICGVVAAGAPVAGIVYGYDAKGTRTPVATISATGSYTLDTTGLTAPYMITAIGVSNLKPTVVHSIATSADLGNTVNVTPLTDVILSLAAGQPAQDIGFASMPAVASNVLASASAVNNIIAPLASAVGVTVTSPLTDTFSANGTGMDKVLDSIDVIPATQGGTIDVRLAGQTASLGTVTLPATAGGAATVTANTTVTAAQLANAQKFAAAIADANVCMASLTSLYATSIPSATAVQQFLDLNFLGYGMNQSQFATYFTTPAPNGRGSVGLQFAIGAVADYDFTPPTAGVSVTYPLPAPATFDAAGNVTAFWAEANIAGFKTLGKVIKGPAYGGCPGGWKMGGDYRVVGDVGMTASIGKQITAIGGTGTFSRNLDVRMGMTEFAKFAGASSVMVTGPGFATASFGTAPVAVASLTLVPGAAAQSAMYIAGQNNFGLPYCADVTAATPTLCFDETKAAAGTIYTWSVRSTTNAVLYEYADQYLRGGEIPYGQIIAQEASIFPVITGVTPTAPNLISQLNALAAGQALPTISTSFTLPPLSNNGTAGGLLYIGDNTGALVQAFQNPASPSLGIWTPPPGSTKSSGYTAASVIRNIESTCLGYGVNTTFNF